MFACTRKAPTETWKSPQVRCGKWIGGGWCLWTQSRAYSDVKHPRSLWRVCFFSIDVLAYCTEVDRMKSTRSAKIYFKVMWRGGTHPNWVAHTFAGSGASAESDAECLMNPIPLHPRRLSIANKCQFHLNTENRFARRVPRVKITFRTSTASAFDFRSRTNCVFYFCQHDTVVADRTNRRNVWLMIDLTDAAVHLFIDYIINTCPI